RRTARALRRADRRRRAGARGSRAPGRGAGGRPDRLYLSGRGAAGDVGICTRKRAMSTLRCGFIGLGAMGAPMAGHLAAKGLLTVVGNRTHTKARALAAELGVGASADAAGFAGCGAVMLCVSADADVLANVRALAGGLRPGGIVVDHSTVARDTAIEAQKILAAKGIGFIDAPVSGGVEGARNGRLSVMCGADPALLETVRPALECYGARVSRMGPVGSGQ